MTYQAQILRELAEMAKLDMLPQDQIGRIVAYLQTDEGRANVADLERNGCRISDAADLMQYLVH